MPTKKSRPSTRRPRDIAVLVDLNPDYACGGSFTATEPLRVYDVRPKAKSPAKPRRR